MTNEKQPLKSAYYRFCYYPVPVTLSYLLSVYWNAIVFENFESAYYLHELFDGLFFAVILINLASIILLSVGQVRDFAKHSLAASSICLFICIFGQGFSNDIKHNALFEATQRSKPLISAIKKYQIDKNSPPPSLHSLVPDYLPQVPKTGLPRNSDYQYTNQAPGVTSWKLSIPCTGVLSFDEFYYLPEHNYQIGDVIGGWNERIGDWIYFHE